MTYGFTIDQEFAIINELSLVQVSTLAAFMTLPIWSKTVAIDGFVWYQYSDEKMAEDFPLLFGVAKRCYKNITELADMGFVELTKLGRVKYVRFTSRCADWNKKKEQIRSNSPKTDQEKSENGPANSPKTDPVNNDYNIINPNIKDKAADGGLFDSQADFKPVVVTAPGKRGRKSKEKIPFEETEYFGNPKKFCERLAETGEFPSNTNYQHYYFSAMDWSAKGGRYAEWVAGVRNWIRSDAQKGQLAVMKGSALSSDAMEYLKDMAEI